METLLLTSVGSDPRAVDAARRVLARSGPVQTTEALTRTALEGVLGELDGRRLVLVGGDGAAHEVVRQLWRGRQLAATPIGLIAVGAPSELARQLGLPLDPAAAAQLVLDGRPRRLDLLRDDQGGVVVHAVRLGLPAPRRTWPGRLRRRRGWRIRVEVDDELPADGRGTVATVEIGTGDGMDDGALHVVVTPADGSAPRQARGRATTVYVEPGAELDAVTDGAPGRMARQRSWWVEPGAWQLIC